MGEQDVCTHTRVQGVCCSLNHPLRPLLGLLTIIRKNKAKSKEMRVLFL
jgi:hypothetical protein